MRDIMIKIILVPLKGISGLLIFSGFMALCFFGIIVAFYWGPAGVGALFMLIMTDMELTLEMLGLSICGIIWLSGLFWYGYSIFESFKS